MNENKAPSRKMDSKDKKSLIIIGTVAILTISAFALSLGFGFSSSPNNNNYAWYNAKAGLYTNEGKYIDGSLSSLKFIENGDGVSLSNIENDDIGAFSLNLPASVSIDGDIKPLNELGDGENNIFSGDQHHSIGKVYASKNITKINSYAFANDENLVYYSQANQSGVSTQIGDKAFYKANKLEKIYLPNNLVSIGEYAFAYCPKLSSINLIETSLNQLSKGLFLGSYNLSEITLPAYIYSLGDESLSKTGIKEFSSSFGLETMGEAVFAGCHDLNKIDLLNGKMRILKDRLFSDCESMQYLQISNKISKIEGSPFSNCSLENITYHGSSAEWAQIDKSEDWLKDSNIKSVTCTDKTVEI